MWRRDPLARQAASNDTKHVRGYHTAAPLIVTDQLPEHCIALLCVSVESSANGY
jgi:hypothetical protein